MKTTNISINENDYSLHSMDNYYINFTYSLSEILIKYIYLINEFFKFILEKIKLKNNIYFKFIIIRGYETITNVFNIILYYTKNVDLTFYHCQKSYYYYIEFIEQISYEHHIFLELTSKDASTYVYKKTLFDLNHDLKKNIKPCSNEIKNTMQILDEQIKVFKIIFEFVIENLYLEKSLNDNTQIIDKYETICKKIIVSKLKIEQIIILYKIVEDVNKKIVTICSDKESDYLLFDKYFEILSKVLNILKKQKQQQCFFEFCKIIESKYLFTNE
jgi:hypothetical protein